MPPRRGGRVRRAATRLRGSIFSNAPSGQYGSLDLQVSAAMRGSGLITTGLASALRSGRNEAVFEWSERARAMTGSILPLRPPPDPQLASDLAELRVLRTAQPDGDWLATPRAALLRDRARERQWSQTAAGETRDRVSLGDAVAALDAGDVLLSFVFDGVKLAVLAASRAGTSLNALDWRSARSALSGLRADLDMAATITSGPMAVVVRRGLDDRLATLSALLLEPIGAQLARAERVLITAPGILAGIPWMMLPALRHRTLSVARSVTSWMEERGHDVSPAQSAGFAAGPRVARGDEEVEVAAAAWASAAVLRGAAANVADVTELAARVDVLHIAAHGRHAVDNPLFSGLELADGTLFGYDIDLIPKVPADRRALGLRGRALVGPLGRGGDRNDADLAPRRHPVRHRRARHRRRRRRVRAARRDARAARRGRGARRGARRGIERDRDRRAVPGARSRILKIRCIRVPLRVLLVCGNGSRSPASGDRRVLGAGRRAIG